MIQRDNGLPGTTKVVNYKILENDSSTKSLNEILELLNNLSSDGYFLVECHRIRGTKWDYIATFRSKKEGLR